MNGDKWHQWGQSKRDRKAQVAWFGDREHMLGNMYLYKKQKPELFGFAKGIVLGLKCQWKAPFVLVRIWDGPDRTEYVVNSETQYRPIEL